MESMVRYHAREVAKFRCTQHKGLLVLGSATPAIESRYAAETGQYHLFTLTQRYNAHPLPQVFLADMRQELRRGNATGLSAKLREELEENLARETAAWPCAATVGRPPPAPAARST